VNPRSYKPILIVFLIYTFWFIPSIAGAEIKVQILQAYAVPENVSVNVGDTVTWLAGGPSNIQVVESYTGEWKSPFLAEQDPRSQLHSTSQDSTLIAFAGTRARPTSQ